METILLYIALNVLLFGSLYLLAKAVETATWYLIENYNDLIHRMEKFMVDRKQQ